MFLVPTLRDLAVRVRQSFNANLPGTDAWVQRNNIAPTAKIFAGALYELFERLDWVMKQAFVLYAEEEWLDRHGGQYGLPRKPAALAAGDVAVTALDAVLLPAGTLFSIGDVSYAAIAEAALTEAGTFTVAVVAQVAGADANGLAGTPLTITAGSVAPPSGPGLDGIEAVIGPAGIFNGADAERDGPYRARILFRMRNPPHGGNAADYVMWASAVPGVTRVFVERLWRGAGTVRVFPVFDDYFVAAGGVASTAYIDAVRSTLQLVQPAVAIVTVVAPEPYPVGVTIRNLSPDTSATRTAIRLELMDMIRRKGRVAGIDQLIAPMPYLARPHIFAALWVQGAVDSATGVDSAEVVDVEDHVIPAGMIPVLGALVFE